MQSHLVALADSNSRHIQQVEHEARAVVSSLRAAHQNELSEHNVQVGVLSNSSTQAITTLRSELQSQQSEFRRWATNAEISCRKSDELLVEANERNQAVETTHRQLQLEYSMGMASSSGIASQVQAGLSRFDQVDGKLEALSLKIVESNNRHFAALSESERRQQEALAEIWDTVSQIVHQYRDEVPRGRSHSTATFGDEPDQQQQGEGQPLRNPKVNIDFGQSGSGASGNAGEVPTPTPKVPGGPPHVPPLLIPDAPDAATMLGYRPKEKEEIIVPCLPTPANFRQWKHSVRKAVAAASGDPDEAFTWICQVDEVAMDIDTLSDSGRYKTLDVKLSAALNPILTGDLAKQISALEEQYGAKGKFMKGRQILWKIYYHYRMTHAEGTLYEFQDLLAVKLKGGDLRTFQTDWDLVISGMRQVPE